MAVRRRALEPDTTIYTQEYGEFAVVSDAAFLEAAVAFAQMQLIAGGVVTAIVDRHPTDIPEESVTTRAIFEWKNRTDAKAQPEAQTGVAQPPPEFVQGAGGSEPDLTPAELEAQLAREATGPTGPELEEPEEHEDEESIPAGMR